MVPYGPLSPCPLALFMHKTSKEKAGIYPALRLVFVGFLLNFDLFGADLGVSVIILLCVVYCLVYVVADIATIIDGIYRATYQSPGLAYGQGVNNG